MTAFQKWLDRQHFIVLTLFGMIAAFSTYACMYAFRKPFSAATYEGEPKLLGLDYKQALVIIQLVGYMLSKFIGIKFVSEMGRRRRAISIVILIMIAELALLGFALTPAPYSAAFLFLNGLPLGMVWGLVFSFLEGRRTTEMMGLGLCASFVFSSGFVKDIGKYLMAHGIPTNWMPFVTGAIFFLPLLISVLLLSQVPPPNAKDESLRTRREPMKLRERWQFFVKFAPGLILFIITYMLLTAYRDFRDSFQVDIYKSVTGSEDIDFGSTENWVSICVLAGLMWIVLVKDNWKAFVINHVMILLGVIFAGVGTILFQMDHISPKLWLFLTGLGTYFAYIPFNTLLFERMIASFRIISNIGFLIYLADSFGYLGSLGVVLYKAYSSKSINYHEFFEAVSLVLAVVGFICMLISLFYFHSKRKRVDHNNNLT